MPRTIDLNALALTVDKEIGATRPRKMRKSLLYIQSVLKITKKDLAVLLDVSYGTLILWMDGLTMPNDENRARIRALVKEVKEQIEA